MNPERRNELALAVIAWLVTALGILTALFIAFGHERPDGAAPAGDEVAFALIFPGVAIVIGLIGCFERPRSGVKRTVSFLGLLPVILSGLVLIAVVSGWFGIAR